MTSQGGYTQTVAGTITNNPAQDVVIVDSGQITETGFYDVKIIVSSDADAKPRLEYRDAANATTLKAFPIFIGTSAPAEFILRLPVAAVNERFRVAMVSAFVGNICAHINVNRVG